MREYILLMEKLFLVGQMYVLQRFNMTDASLAKEMVLTFFEACTFVLEGDIPCKKVLKLGFNSQTII